MVEVEQMKSSKTKEIILTINYFLDYLLLIIGFSCYLLIILTQKDFVPNRLSLALNLCSGLFFVAVNQLRPVANILDRDLNRNENRDTCDRPGCESNSTTEQK